MCVVHSAKTRFEGGNPTFFNTIGFALSKIHLIFLWGVLSATVGVVLAVLRNAASKSGSVGGRVAAGAAHGIGSMAWSITTIFVIPAMVFYNLTPFAAIKKSVQTLKKTWGESLVKHFGMGLIKFFVYLAIVGIIVLAFYLTWVPELQTILIIIGVGLLVIVITALTFSAADEVYDTALFIYADKGKVPSGWNKQVLANSFE
jgi:hypothetical protein